MTWIFFQRHLVQLTRSGQVIETRFHDRRRLGAQVPRPLWRGSAFRAREEHGRQLIPLLRATVEIRHAFECTLLSGIELQYGFETRQG